MLDVASSELDAKSRLEAQKQAFRDRFGREPLPGEFLLFEPETEGQGKPSGRGHGE
jgi:hypothetical protein